MFVEIFGSILLMVSAAYYSFHGMKRELKIRKILEELCGLFTCLYKNIECYTIPLVEICRVYTSEELEKLGFYHHWQQGAFLDAVDTLEDIPEKVLISCRQYVMQAGKGYKETELQLCRGILGELEEALAVQKREMQTKNKLYRTLPYLLVLSVILLFI